MSILESAHNSIDKVVALLERTQDSEGRWVGSERSSDLWFYAMGLKLAGEQSDSPIIQDIADLAESWADPKGGFGAYPGEPADGYQTSLVMPFLKWARPKSPALASAAAYLRRLGDRYQNPPVAMSRWIFDRDPRALADNGPPGWLRKIAVDVSKVHLSQRWNLAEKYPGYYQNPSLLRRLLEPTLLRAFTYPPTDRLEDAAVWCAIPAGFDFMLFAYASLRRIANDTSAGANRLAEFAKQRRSRFAYADGAYEWITLLVADLFFTEVFGLDDEHQNALAKLRTIVYQGSGWLHGDLVSINVYDTALTARGLCACGVSQHDSILRRAVSYLKRSRSPEHGLWSWRAYGDTGRMPLDTDDCGLALMALSSAGEQAGSEVLAKAMALADMQEPRGAFSLYGEPNVRPNWCWVSNTSRSLQGLLACGCAPSDERVQRAASWLLSQRLNDGSWIDGWCARYIYGTVLALEGLLAAQAITPGGAIATGAVEWLLKRQNEDGGWGETWVGSRSASTAEHTGLALYGLAIASEPQPYPLQALTAGVRWLCDNQRADGSWEATYFMGYGFDVGLADAQLPIAWAMHGLGHALRTLSREGQDLLRLDAQV